MTDSVKEAVKTSNSDLVIVPGGCTKYIQAPDVCWNKPFKEFFGTKYDHWMAEGVHQYTEAGNMKPPARKKIVQWILCTYQLFPGRCGGRADPRGIDFFKKILSNSRPLGKHFLSNSPP